MESRSKDNDSVTNDTSLRIANVQGNVNDSTESQLDKKELPDVGHVNCLLKDKKDKGSNSCDASVDFIRKRDDCNQKQSPLSKKRFHRQ